MAITNVEIFENFCDEVRNETDNKEIMKMFGGGHIYVPSFKGAIRDEEIYKRHCEGEEAKTLHRDYNLSVNQIRTIIKKMSEKAIV